MKQKNRNPWDILGVDRNSTQEEIRIAFRKLSMKWHPDKGGNAEQFRIINDAYNKLKNKRMVPIIDVPPTRLINVKLTIDQQLNGINDYIQVEDDLFIKVKIPAGSIAGDKYRVKDNGQNFIINVQEKIDNDYSRHGFSLMANLDIDIVTAMTGGTIEIKGPNGKPLMVDIPAGIRHNEVITIHEAGLLNRRTRKRGGLHIKTNLVIPQLLSQSDIDEFINRLTNVRN